MNFFRLYCIFSKSFFNSSFSSLILINSREEVVLLAKFGDVFSIFILYFRSCIRSPLRQYFSNLNVHMNHLRF